MPPAPQAHHVFGCQFQLNRKVCKARFNPVPKIRQRAPAHRIAIDISARARSVLAPPSRTRIFLVAWLTFDVGDELGATASDDPRRRSIA